jgi:acetyl-CoA/propionyl-CoA carboxylase biotin carboxyl carrier protein
VRGSFDVYTQWIETEFDNQIEPRREDCAVDDDHGSPLPWFPFLVEVEGRRLEVVLHGGLGGLTTGGGGNGAGAKKATRSAKKAGAAASGDAVTSPIQGTIVKVVVEEGQAVAEGDTIVVMEAIKAHKAGTVTSLQAEVGATVTNGAVICDLKD